MGLWQSTAFFYKGYPCFTLTCAAASNHWFGCCCDNQSRCADLSYCLCCPCRVPGSIALTLLGGVLDAVQSTCHCFGHPCRLNLTHDLCDCSCLATPEWVMNESDLVHTAQACALSHTPKKPIMDAKDLMYAVCCQRGSLHSEHFVDNGRRLCSICGWQPQNPAVPAPGPAPARPPEPPVARRYPQPFYLPAAESPSPAAVRPEGVAVALAVVPPVPPPNQPAPEADSSA